jgi:hypothetical protein
LHLGPAGNGQVQDDAVERPALKKLIEAGEIEVLGEGGASAGAADKSSRIRGSTQGHPPSRGSTRRGDR